MFQQRAQRAILFRTLMPALFGLILLALLPPGCGKQGDSTGRKTPSAQGEQRAVEGKSAAAGPIIGVSLLTRTHPFYQDLEAGLRAASAERGYQLIVQAGEFDVAKQKDQIEDFLVRKVAAIIVCPCDSKSIGTSIEAANRAGVPVFTADIAVLAPGVKVVCHVASDNEAGGRLAAQAVSQAIGERGKVAIIDHPEVESVIQRVRGFEEEMAKTPSLRIVAKLSGRGMKDVAFRTAEDILQAHPDLDVIFGINDDTALGALAAVEKAGKAGRVRIIGFDAVPEARAAIGEGKIYADVIQQPQTIGRKTIEAIAAYMSGQQVPPTVLIPCALYGQDDARKDAAEKAAGTGAGAPAPDHGESGH
jgi:ribose transport system substrate-binding protein